ncbi:MAG: 3-oxoacyl-ACP reductase FabG [Chitinophagaceae bacterium]
MNCALITGASKGIGRAIALQLSKDHGLHILINYSSDTNAAQETLDKIRSGGGSGELLKFKVQDKSAVDASIGAWLVSNPEKFIKVLVNNAGITKDGLFMWMSETNWDDVIAVSLKGLFNVTQIVIRQMMKNKAGRIINISSISGLRGVPGQTNYSTAKAGIIGATKALAQEVAKMNITVNAVAPGFINTALLENIEMDKYLKVIPAGRIGEPEEVAHMVSFLASEKSSYITGEVININGGLYS